MGFRKGAADIFREFKDAFRDSLNLIVESREIDSPLAKKRGVFLVAKDYLEGVQRAGHQLYNRFMAGKDVDVLLGTISELQKEIEEERTRRQALELLVSDFDFEEQRIRALENDMKHAQFESWTATFYKLTGELERTYHELRLTNQELDQFKTGERHLDMQRERIVKRLGQRRERLAQQSQLLEIYAQKVKTGFYYAQARAKSPEAFEQWKKTVETPLVARVNEAEKAAESARFEARVMKGAAIQTAVDFMVKRYEGAADVPFVYYDFNTHYLVLTPAARGFLGVEAKEDFNVSSFLFKIRGSRAREGDRDRVKKVISAIREGKKLSQEHIKTTDGKDLYLTSYPYPPQEGKARYPLGVDMKYKTALGVGIFLYDPGFSSPIKYFRKPKATANVARELTEVCGGVLERLGELMSKPQIVRAT